MHIQGLDQSMMTLTIVSQKGMDDRNTWFDKMFKNMTDHENRMARVLQDFERASKMESAKA